MGGPKNNRSRRRRVRNKDDGELELTEKDTADAHRDVVQQASWLNALAAMSLRGVEAGVARPNHTSGSVAENGPHPLHVAVMEGDMAQIEELLEAGADPNEVIPPFD